jgi:hypothetical protein
MHHDIRTRLVARDTRRSNLTPPLYTNFGRVLVEPALVGAVPSLYGCGPKRSEGSPPPVLANMIWSRMCRTELPVNLPGDSPGMANLFPKSVLLLTSSNVLDNKTIVG